MRPNAWMRRIGKELWNYVVDDGSPEDTATIMTRLYEIGWRGPEVQPRIDTEGVKVLWPVDDKEVGSLTSEGLARFWRARGHKWLLLRASQVCSAMAGPLAPRFQELLVAYTEQCESEGLDVLPKFADWKRFVGGQGETVDSIRLFRGLETDSDD